MKPKNHQVLAIDPGSEKSALVCWDGQRIGVRMLMQNESIRDWLRPHWDVEDVPQTVPLVIEQVVSYGMPVGASIFETVYWSGKFAEAYQGPVFRVPRMSVKTHICHNSRAKDSNIRQAVIDRFGAPGTKKAPGLTYGLKRDLWQAFALAVYYHDTKMNGAAID